MSDTAGVETETAETSEVSSDTASVKSGETAVPEEAENTEEAPLSGSDPEERLPTAGSGWPVIVQTMAAIPRHRAARTRTSSIIVIVFFFLFLFSIANQKLLKAI